MPVVSFSGTMPSSEEFRRALSEAIALATPLDDLLVLAAQLRKYEDQYQLTSADFYHQYQAGTLHEELQHCMEWAATYALFIKTRRMIK